MTVTRRVPQGSILGPTLFLLYVNEFKECGIRTLAGLYILQCVLFVKTNYELALAARSRTITAQEKQMVLPETTKPLVYKSAISRVLKIYNRLPINTDAFLEIA